MTDKNREIEEMAKVLHLNYDMPYEFSKGLAEFLIDEGYAKASDVAMEIFAEIEKMLKGNEAICENKMLADIGNWIFHEYLPKELAELKKKYTEEATDEE